MPYGYNPSDYVINSKKLLEETPATAVSKDVLDSKTCWVNGVEIIGTMPNNNAQKMLVDCDEVYTIPDLSYWNCKKHFYKSVSVEYKGGIF